MDSPVDYAGPAACGGPFARLTLNSPHNRNALSSTLVSQLHQGLSAAEADPAVRLVVLGHTGGTFCAGADLSEAGGGGGDPYRMAVARAREMTALLRAIVESPLPVVGAINGHVRAGGFGLVRRRARGAGAGQRRAGGGRTAQARRRTTFGSARPPRCGGRGAGRARPHRGVRRPRRPGCGCARGSGHGQRRRRGRGRSAARHGATGSHDHRRQPSPQSRRPEPHRH